MFRQSYIRYPTVHLTCTPCPSLIKNDLCRICTCSMILKILNLIKFLVRISCFIQFLSPRFKSCSTNLVFDYNKCSPLKIRCSHFLTRLPCNMTTSEPSRPEIRKRAMPTLILSVYKSLVFCCCCLGFSRVGWMAGRGSDIMTRRLNSSILVPQNFLPKLL